MTEREREPLIHLCQGGAQRSDLPPAKTNHRAEVMDVAVLVLALLPSGRPTLYISFMHSKLNLHLDGFPGPHPTQQIWRERGPFPPPATTGRNEVDLLSPGLLCKDDV